MTFGKVFFWWECEPHRRLWDEWDRWDKKIEGIGRCIEKNTMGWNWR